jgi:hypothetical protein
VPLRDLTTDVQPQPEARNVALGCIGRSTEWLEDALLGAQGQADAAVTHGQQDAMLVTRQLDVDGLTTWAVLGGIVQQIRKHLLESMRISYQRTGLTHGLELEPRKLSASLLAGRRATYQVSQVDLAEAEWQAALLQ